MTHAEPITNTNIMPIFWAVFMWSLRIRGNGSARMTRSVTIPKDAVALNMDKISMQEPPTISTSQALCMGLHAKRTAKNRDMQYPITMNEVP